MEMFVVVRMSRSGKMELIETTKGTWKFTKEKFDMLNTKSAYQMYLEEELQKQTDEMMIRFYHHELQENLRNKDVFGICKIGEWVGANYVPVENVEGNFVKSVDSPTTE
ncbi:MAG TPA: hypothetical protein VFK73_06955 [Paludibacter sp.]|nr:hypothetical protein [Paludibacter sp.]